MRYSNNTLPDSNEYNAEFPEQYNWELLDSFKLTKAALFIQSEISTDLLSGRHKTPGLRKALEIIYGVDQCNP